MSTTQAICTQCGATIQVSLSNEAEICPVCGKPFVVSSATRLFQNKTVLNSAADHSNAVIHPEVYTIFNTTFSTEDMSKLDDWVLCDKHSEAISFICTKTGVSKQLAKAFVSNYRIESSIKEVNETLEFINTKKPKHHPLWYFGFSSTKIK